MSVHYLLKLPILVSVENKKYNSVYMLRRGVDRNFQRFQKYKIGDLESLESFNWCIMIR